MKRRKKKEEERPGTNMRAALATAATVLGVSLGATIQPASAAPIGLEAFTLSTDQLKIGASQLKIDGLIQMKLSVDPAQIGSNLFKIDLANLKLDASQLKLDIANQLKIDIANYKLDLANFLYIIPQDVSPASPFLVPFADFPLDPLTGQPIISFLTIGIESFTYDITADGLLITSVVRKPVPEPASLLLLGAGVAALFAGRKMLVKDPE